MPSKKKIVPSSVVQDVPVAVAKKHTVKKKVVYKKIETKRAEPIECQVHHKYVLLGVCSSCDHLPMRATNLVVVLSLVIAVLSGMIISLVAPLDLDFQLSLGNIGQAQLNHSIAQNR
jgi:hypothetical protein